MNVNMVIKMLDRGCNFAMSKAKRCFRRIMVKHYDCNMEY